MPAGQVIARHGEIGTQAATLMPGLYWRMSVVWSMRRSKVVQVAETEIATVEAIDGRPLPKGRLLGDEVECNQFQDGEAFLDNGGFKGPQVAIIRPGTYRINPFLFSVAKQPATEVASGKVGVVTAQDGQPLPPKFIVAPQPEGGPSASHPSARSHNFFQDGQAFLDSGGFRGPQLDTLQPGRYYVNRRSSRSRSTMSQKSRRGSWPSSGRTSGRNWTRPTSSPCPSRTVRTSTRRFTRRSSGCSSRSETGGGFGVIRLPQASRT